MSSPDLSLPSKSPTKSHHEESHNCDKVAIYTLVDLGEGGMNALIKFLQNNDETLEDVASLPPKYNFTGESLRDVYDYHLKLDKQISLHPTLLVVAQHQDYQKNGVLLVNLDTDLECSVDICRVKASEAVSLAVNLMLANMDWEEIKDDELPLPSSDDNMQAEIGSGSRKVGSSEPDPSQAGSTFHSIFAVYTTAGADMTDIRAYLEPDWSKKDPKTYMCESVGSYTKFPDSWGELIKHHPWNCRRNPRLHRQWFICADTKEPKEKGVLLVHMDWDGNITRDPEELLRIGLGVPVLRRQGEIICRECYCHSKAKRKVIDEVVSAREPFQFESLIMIKQYDQKILDQYWLVVVEVSGQALFAAVIESSLASDLVSFFFSRAMKFHLCKTPT